MTCTWDASKANRNEQVLRLLEEECLVPVCPEQLGGLRTPRARQEMVGGKGVDVLEGRARVKNSEDVDVTRQFLRGAHETLRIARLLNAGRFVGKARSPSCGCGEVYDGSFSGKVTGGDGVTTALLRRNGVEVLTEEDLEQVRHRESRYQR